MPDLRKITSNPTLHGFIDQGIVSGLNFILAVILIKNFGLPVFGDYSALWLIFLFTLSLFQVFINLPGMVLKTGVENPTNYLIQNRKIGDLLIIISTPFVIVSSFLIPTNFSNSSILLIAIAILLYLRQDSLRKFFYSIQRNNLALMGSLLQLSILCIGYFLLFFTNVMDFNMFILLLIVGSLSANIVYQYLFSKWVKLHHAKAFSNKKVLILNWKYAKPLLATSLLQFFSGNFIHIAVLGFLGNNALGILRMIQNILGVLHVLLLALENIIPAKAAKYFQGNEFTKYKKFVFENMKLSGLIFIGTLVTLALFAQPILHYLYGENVEDYAYLLQLFTGIYILIFLGTWLQLILKITSNNNGILIAYLLALMVGGILAQPMVTNFGLTGAVVMFGILQVVTNTIYLIRIKKLKLLW